MDEKYISESDKIKARQANLAEYLINHGEPLKRIGRRYQHSEHDSLIFTENAYFWNSRGEHGNAIDYLVRHKGFTFIEAVKELLAVNTPSQNVNPNFSWSGIEKTADMRRTIAYLTKHRGIDETIVTDFIKRKLLFQQLGTNNAIFPIYDETGEIVGAELAGTLSDKRFKGVESGSKYGYGFNVLCGSNPRYILFFESAIDLLSFMDIKRDIIEKMKGSILVSLAGLKISTFKHSLKAFGDTLQPVLCVDNDNAGDDFLSRLQAEFDGLKVYCPEPQFKDWNDQLRAIKSDTKTHSLKPRQGNERDSKKT